MRGLDFRGDAPDGEIQGAAGGKSGVLVMFLFKPLLVYKQGTFVQHRIKFLL